MSHDFSKRMNAKKTPKKSKPRLPAWLWLLTGLTIGIGATLFNPIQNNVLTPSKAPAIKNVSTQTIAIEEPDTKTTTTDTSTTEPKKTSTVHKPTRFEFYAILPEQEVMIQELHRPRTKDNNHGTSKSDTTRLTHNSASQYILQAGSFQHTEDANVLYRNILAANLPVKIEQGIVSRGDIETTWHRVIVGPFNNTNSLQDAERKLSNIGIKTLLMKQR